MDMYTKGIIAEQKSYGFKNLVELGVENFFFVKFRHTDIIYFLCITIYVYKRKLCRTKVLWV